MTMLRAEVTFGLFIAVMMYKYNKKAYIPIFIGTDIPRRQFSINKRSDSEYSGVESVML